MKRKNKEGDQQKAQYNVGAFIEGIEPYWKILFAAATIAAVFFRIGVWVGERNNLDEISKVRNDYSERITELTIQLANQDRRPIVINLNDSIKNGK